MTDYQFKKLQELSWFVLTAAAIAVIDIVRVQDFNAILDWGSFAMILAGAGARAGIAAGGTWLTANVIAKFKGEGGQVNFGSVATVIVIAFVLWLMVRADILNIP